MKHLFTVLVTVLFVYICSSEAVAQTTLVGETKNSYNVSPNGSFNYTVPLRIPPGIKDMVPELAITYNSQSGNGLLGVGWSISGLSAITRGVPTIYHDGFINPADLNTDDALYLDGQRLFGGPTYVTEVKNFATIQSFGTAGNGPAYFTVEYPNGTVYEYGADATGNSRMLAQGKTTALMWAVNKIIDAYGNYIEFEYTNLQSTGEYRIDMIKYGKNEDPNTNGNTIPYFIKFNYQIRSDENEVYVNGSEVLSNKLLSSIEVLFADQQTVANKYEFSYDTDMLSRLIKIQEIPDPINNKVLPPININWGQSPQWASPPALNYMTHNSYTAFTPISGDFNGDGYSDIVSTHPGSGTTDISIYMSVSGVPTYQTSQTLSFQVTALNNFPSSSHTQGRRTVDYNGDGMDDLIYIEHVSGTQNLKTYKMWYLEADGSPNVFKAPVLIHWRSNNLSDNTHFYDYILLTNGDYDGDGKSEMISFIPFSFNNNGNEVDQYEVFVVGEEYNGGHKINHTDLAHISSLYTLDFNGDGKDEFMFTHVDNSVHKANTWGLWVSSYNSNFSPQLYQTPTQWPVWGYGMHGFPNKYDQCWFGDFNGDGKSDVLTWDATSYWSIAYSDGVEPAYSNPGHWPNVVTNTSHQLSALSQYGPGIAGGQSGGIYGWYIADFNADGYADFLQLIVTAANTFEYKLFYSTGKDFYQTYGTLTVPGAHNQRLALGDFDGDGQVDIMHTDQYKGHLIKFRSEDNSLKVTSIEHLGKTIDIEYETLVKDADYVKLPTGNGYFKNRTLPIKVVKGLSDNVSLANSYVYKGLMYHTCGLGLRGFKNFEIENNIQQKTYQEYDLTSKQHPFLTRTQVFDAYAGMPFASETNYQYLDFDGGASGKCRIVISNPAVTKDYLKGVKTENVITTGLTTSGTVFYDFGKVEKTETYQKDLNGASTYGYKSVTPDYGMNWSADKGKPISVTTYSEMDPSGLNGITRVVDYTYNSKNDIATTTTDAGTNNEKTITFTYDSKYGNLIEEETVGANITDPLKTQYGYTNDRRFVDEEIVSVDPAANVNYTTTYTYDDASISWGNLLSTTDIKGNKTQYLYDELNRLVYSKDVVKNYETNTVYQWANSSQYSTTNTDQLFSVVSTSPTIVNNSFYSEVITDKYGREIRMIETGPGGHNITDYTYTTDGKLYTSTSPHGNFQPHVTTTYGYDDYGRETSKVSDNNGPQIYTTYSINGSGLLETTIINGGANNRSKTYETCGDYLKRVFNPSLTEDISYTYHGNGEKAVTISNGMRFENKVDNYGRVREIIQPNAGTKKYTYDAFDRIDIETLTNNIQYQYTYDNLGRVLTKQEIGTGVGPYTNVYGNTPFVGETGELKSEEAPNGNRVEYVYHPSGEVDYIEEYNGLQNFISLGTFATYYTYREDGLITEINYTGDISVNYEYNVYGGLSTVTLKGSQFLPSSIKLWEAHGYNSYGQINGAYFFDQTGTQLYDELHSYDMFGQRTASKVMNNNFLVGPYVKDMVYNFDVHTGNLLSRSDNNNGFNETFDYDAYFDRLTKITSNVNPVIDMAYDGNPSGASLGNLSKKTDIVTNPVSVPEWKYDGYALKVIPDFNNVSVIPTFRQDVSYTNFQKVLSIEEENNNKVDFEYGPDDQRVKAEYRDITGGSGNPVLMHTKYYANNYEYIVDNQNPGNGDLHNVYILANGVPIAILRRNTLPVSTPFNQIASETLYYTITDYVGSITHILDDNGSSGMLGIGVVEERSYDAWGRVRDPQTWQAYPTGPGGFPGNWLTDRGYTGQEHIWLGMYDNNVINLNGRLYDPLVGRMFSPDPYIPDATNSQDYNKYTYARNNPLKYTDKDGEWVQMAVGAAMGAYAGYQIGKDKAGSGWYILGGAVIGAASGGIGTIGTTSGGIMANSMGILGSSMIYSGGMFALSGGQSQLIANFGAGSFNFSTGSFRGLWNWNDLSTAERIGYSAGALANIQDIAALGNGTHVRLRSRKNPVGHSEINGDGITISVGPAEPNPRFENLKRGKLRGALDWEYRYYKLQQAGTPWPGENVSYIRANDQQFITHLYNINGKQLKRFTSNLSNGLGLFGKSPLVYGLDRGCVNFTSRALLYSGVINMNAFLPLTSPVLLQAEIGLRNLAIYSSPYLVHY